MSKLKLGLSVLGVVAIVAVASLVVYSRQPKTPPAFGYATPTSVNSTFNTTTDSLLNNETDIFGTHIGTSTVGGVFATPNVTTSVVSVIAGKNQATYQIKVTAVTSTVNNFSFTVQGSNDYLCNTLAGNASSTTDVVQKNINWYDAMVYLANRVHPTSFSNASSSLVLNWVNATADSAQTVVLKDLNFQCIRAIFSGSSTQPYIGLTTK